MKKSSTRVTKRNRIIPNERRRQTWRKHRLGLIDRRSKWFYQQANEFCEDEQNSAAEVAAEQAAPEEKL